MDKLLFAGSFDPVTRGHVDIISRAAALCDTLVVAVMVNPDKKGAIPPEERVRLLKLACRQLPNVQVIAHGGLLVDCAREQGVQAVVRGIRPLGDFETEYQMARINRMMGGVETLMLVTSEQFADISSSIVRQIASFGGDISRMVPDGLAEEIIIALARGQDGGEHHGR
ncbi:MAG: pantetheine-phosphate adenylyltransferase [Clostridia bacterium]|nr:pantetheine-phosphate adenylyltransferase [Clostridia bacterium]